MDNETTKDEYIKAHPRTTLASVLSLNDWPDDQRIEIVKGLEVTEASHNMSRGSNLSRALSRSESKEYETGAKCNGKFGGWWFAVKVKERP